MRCTHVINQCLRIGSFGSRSMTIDQRHGRRQLTVCETDLGGCSESGCRCDARYNRDRYMVTLQIFYFLTGMSKQHRVTPFEAYYLFTLACRLEQQFVDFILFRMMFATAFTHIKLFGLQL